jgi:CRP/FNR family transcriptional regulator, cyclic AMP receptor protein
MTMSQKTTFDPIAFLANEGAGRRIVSLRARQAFFTQGSPSDSVFYLQTGRAQLTVVSMDGREAIITLLAAGDFVGEESVGGEAGVRLATATAITACSALRIEREQMMRALREERDFSEMFLRFLLTRSIRIQENLIDQRFNSSERRLARTLLMMAEFGEAGEAERLIPQITQETLAEMVGTTRSRVSFFMNRFRRLGFIEYKGRIHVHESLLNMLQDDPFSVDGAVRRASERKKRFL